MMHLAIGPLVAETRYTFSTELHYAFAMVALFLDNEVFLVYGGSPFSLLFTPTRVNCRRESGEWDCSESIRNNLDHPG